MITVLVILIVGSALILGALWGLYGRLPARAEGFVIALAGGALLVSLVSEMIDPAIGSAGVPMALVGLGLGAAVFSGIDYLIDEKWGERSGGGLLAAVTLDGIPENLALGVALISAAPIEIAALVGSIYVSNLPESAGGAREMRASGYSKRTVLAVWSATAVLLSLAALAGRYLLAGLGEQWLAFISCFAAGAVVASLATEVFPKAYREGQHLAGVATALGVMLAILLGKMGGS